MWLAPFLALWELLQPWCLRVSTNNDCSASEDMLMTSWYFDTTSSRRAGENFVLDRHSVHRLYCSPDIARAVHAFLLAMQVSEPLMERPSQVLVSPLWV